jgi:hypothetical protein
MTQAEARARLESMLDWQTDPALSSAEVDMLFSDASRPDRHGYIPDTRAKWAANTAYALGAEIIPTSPNGHFYTVSVAGTSSGSEPTWPTTSAATITSGTATFTEAGRSWAGRWDTNAAAAEGWRWKAAKAANRVTLSTDGQSFSRSDLIAHCNQTADMYAARVVESVAGARPRHHRRHWDGEFWDDDCVEYIVP